MTFRFVQGAGLDAHTILSNTSQPSMSNYEAYQNGNKETMWHLDRHPTLFDEWQDLLCAMSHKQGISDPPLWWPFWEHRLTVWDQNLEIIFAVPWFLVDPPPTGNQTQKTITGSPLLSPTIGMQGYVGPIHNWTHSAETNVERQRWNVPKIQTKVHFMGPSWV